MQFFKYTATAVLKWNMAFFIYICFVILDAIYELKFAHTAKKKFILCQTERTINWWHGKCEEALFNKGYLKFEMLISTDLGSTGKSLLFLIRMKVVSSYPRSPYEQVHKYSISVYCSVVD